MQQQLRDKKGFGLLEILLAIAVAAVIIIISVDYYTNVRGEQKVNYFINQLRSLTTSIENYIHANNGKNVSGIFGTGNNTPYLVNNNIVQQADVQNIWNSGYQYQITVMPNYKLYNSQVQCLAIQVVVDLPQKVSAPVIETKITEAFHNPGTDPSLGSDVTFRQYQHTSSDYYLNIQYCLD